MALHIFDRDGFEYTRPHEATFSGKKKISPKLEIAFVWSISEGFTKSFFDIPMVQFFFIRRQSWHFF